MQYNNVGLWYIGRALRMQVSYPMLLGTQGHGLEVTLENRFFHHVR